MDEELSTTIHHAETAMRRGVIGVTSRIVVLFVGFIHPAFAHDPANYVFTASQTRPDITIIDSSTDEVVGKITLPSIPGDMTALGRGRSLAIADRKASRVHFVDVLAGRVEREMDVPLVPDVLRSDRTGSAIAALDLSAGKVALSSTGIGAFQTLPDVSGATYIVFDANGRLLVAHHGGATIVDATGRRVVAELPVDSAEGPVTISPSIPAANMLSWNNLNRAFCLFSMRATQDVRLYCIFRRRWDVSSRARIANLCLFP
jgi:hypothetical protein